METDIKIAALVPAHNERMVVAKTLAALKNQTVGVDIFVVDDGSSDGTETEASRYTNNLLVLTRNRGKAGAMNAAISQFKLADRYDFILFMDADTQPDEHFVELSCRHFFEQGNEDVFCVVGKVQGIGGSWIANYRLWEYAIAHSVYKSAQADMRAILVVPGCATIYRSSIFKKLQIPSGTLTEDMDFTFLLHRMGFGKMIYEPYAIVYTQDPNTLMDFIKQMNRWYTGFWQTARKYNTPWMGQNIDFEVALLATEGLFSGFATLIVLLFSPFLLYYQSFGILRIPLAVDFFVFFLPTLLWTSITARTWALPLYIPVFYFVRIITSILFIRSFFAAYKSCEKTYTWNTARYSLSKEISTP